MDEALEREIRDLHLLFWSDRDPEGRVFAPLADAYRRAGDYERALKLLGEGLERLPDFATGHVVAGWVHRDRGAPNIAEHCFRRVLELDGENVFGLEGLATILMNRGEVEEARPLFDQALELGHPVATAPNAPDVDSDVGPAPDDVVDIDQLLAGVAAADAPDEAEEPPLEAFEPGEVVDIGDLAASDREDEPGDVVDIADLAADPVEAADEEEDEGEEVVDIADLAADPVEAAGDEPVEVEEEEGEEEEGDAAPRTRTMAELYVSQGLHDRAIRIYEELHRADPSDEEVAARLEELKAPDEREGGDEAVGAYFRRLLAWEPEDDFTNWLNES